MVTHSVKELLWRDLLGWFNPEWHLVLWIYTQSVVNILVHSLSKGAEEAPNASLAATHCTKIKWSVGVAEAEILVVTLKQTLLASKRDYILSVEAVLRVVEVDCSNTCLVCVSGDIAVRNAVCHPNNTLA